MRDNTELRVNLGFRADEPIAYDLRDVQAQKRMVAERCAEARWEVPRLLRAMWDAPDFYFDSMAQVRMDRWSAGRVTLLGDAGYCASPLTGQGTSLALVGAYVLATEPARSDHETAFAAYEERMHPWVELNHALVEHNRDHLEEAPAGESRTGPREERDPAPLVRQPPSRGCVVAGFQAVARPPRYLLG